MQRLQEVAGLSGWMSFHHRMSSTGRSAGRLPFKPFLESGSMTFQDHWTKCNRTLHGLAVSEGVSNVCGDQEMG